MSAGPDHAARSASFNHAASAASASGCSTQNSRSVLRESTRIGFSIGDPKRDQAAAPPLLAPRGLGLNPAGVIPILARRPRGPSAQSAAGPRRPRYAPVMARAAENDDATLGELLGEVEAEHRKHGRRLIPMSEEELDSLEAQIGVLPRHLRAVLGRVGLLTNPFGIYHSVGEWMTAQDFVRERVADAADAYVSFARDGEDDVLLRSDDAAERHVISRVDSCGHEIKTTRTSFVTWLRTRWEQSKRGLAQPRCWVVDFSFRGDADELVGRLAEALGAEVAEWTAAPGRPYVLAWTRTMTLPDGTSVTIHREEDQGWPEGWELPRLAFQVRDDEAHIEDGNARRVEAAFHRAGIDVQVHDGGLYPANMLRDDDDF